MIKVVNNIINKVFFDKVDSRILIFFDRRESAEATVDYINDSICFYGEGLISLRRILEFAEVFDTSSIFKDLLDGVYMDRTLINLEEVSEISGKEKEYGYYIYRNTVNSWGLSLPLPKTSLDEYLEKMEKHGFSRRNKFDKDNCPKPSNPIDILPSNSQNSLVGYEKSKINYCREWIPVSERLPEVGETVLLACKEYGFNCCEYTTTKIGVYNTNYGNILAWMPLPEPYKEGGQNG